MGDVGDMGGDKEYGVLASSIAIPMSNLTEKHRVHFLELPVETHLEILGRLIGFHGGAKPVVGTRLLKNIRL